MSPRSFHRAVLIAITQLFLWASVVASPQASLGVKRHEAVQAPVVLPSRLFGLTIDKVSGKNAESTRRIQETIIEELKAIRESNPNGPLPIIRVVLDIDKDAETGVVTEDYVNLLKLIKSSQSAYVMAEVVDSHYFHFCSKRKGVGADVRCYLERTRNYLTALDNYVQIWEIGNEINGQWAGGKPHELDGKDAFSDKKQKAREEARKSVLRQVEAGYKFLADKNKTTAITFYFNDDGERHSWSDTKDDPQYSMRKWLNDYKSMFSKVKYVFISFYPDDNFAPDLRTGQRTPITPTPEKWADIFKQIKDDYPDAQVGFGEVGAQCKYKKRGSCVILEKEEDSECEDRKCDCCLTAQRDYIRGYYQDLDAQIRTALKAKHAPSYEEAFVGGYFYWQFNSDVINKLAEAKEKSDPKKRQALEQPAIATRQALIDAYKTWR